MIWIVYGVIALAITVVATRISYASDEDHMAKSEGERASDAATLGVLLGLFWPIVVLTFACAFGGYALFSGIGKILTLGMRKSS